VLKEMPKIDAPCIRYPENPRRFMTSRTPMIRSTPTTARLSRRTRVVWGAFGAAMALGCGVLVLGDAGGPRAVPALAVLQTGGSEGGIQPLETPLDRERWNAIVIHHSGTPAGDPGSIARMQGDEGALGLGYHFVIGNGQGMPDGFVFVGPRWNQQKPGAHVASRTRGGDAAQVSLRRSPSAEQLNLHAVGICLVGNGDRREFTEHQMRELVTLVRRIQRTLGIPSDRVFLHGDVAETSSPGRFFPVAAFEEQLLRGAP
jgi:hypothetical protein